MMNNEDMNAYIEILKKDATDENGKIDEIKRKNIDNFYRGLFNEFSEFLGTENLESIVNLKVEHSSVMTKNQEDGFYDALTESMYGQLENYLEDNTWKGEKLNKKLRELMKEGKASWVLNRYWKFLSPAQGDP